MRKAYKVLVARHDRKKQLGRPTRRWEVNIGMDLGEIGWEGMVWRALVITVMVLGVPYRRNISWLAE
jgi:hypothetical protein